MKYLFIFLISLSSQASELRAFYTDYCTFFPEGTAAKPGLWQDCCYEHDLRYWFGGSKKQQYETDIFLKQCVQKKAGSFTAQLMYRGIRAGHFSPIKHKTYWGWGWKPKREFFHKLDSNDLKIIKTEVLKLDMDEDYKNEFLRKYQLAK